jgi:hypothetical protein
MVTDPESVSLKDLYHRRLNLNEFKYKSVIKIENKFDPALLRTSYLSNQIKKRITKSRETIPIK